MLEDKSKYTTGHAVGWCVGVSDLPEHNLGYEITITRAEAAIGLFAPTAADKRNSSCPGCNSSVDSQQKVLYCIL